MTLSDHSFGRETLEEFKKLIEAGTELPYDPVSLAASSAPFKNKRISRKTSISPTEYYRVSAATVVSNPQTKKFSVRDV